MGISPAEMLFGRAINDHLPNPRQFRREWLEMADLRERAMDKRYTYAGNDKNLKCLDPLQPGHHNPTKWNNTGTIVEALPHRQYRVLIDGSRRTTLRNRRFLRKISPQMRQMCNDSTIPELHGFTSPHYFGGT